MIGIKSQEESYYLHIRLLFEEAYETFWEIDAQTYENIAAILNFSGSVKYRLSYIQYWDAAKSKKLSCITETSIDTSKKIYFESSDLFKQQLNQLKGTATIQEVKKLPYLVETVNQISVTGNITENKKNKTATPSPKNNRFFIKLGSIFAISLLILLAFSYSNSSQDSTNKSNDAANAEEIKDTQVDSEFIDEKTSIQKPDKKEPAEDEIDKMENKEEKTPKTASYPTVQLNAVNQFTIPKGKVAITFDDGPTALTKDIVDVLKDYEIGATFFFIGQNVHKYPEAVHYVHNNGYAIGSHSYNHIHLGDLSYESQKQEILRASDLIESTIGEDVHLFRPPYGSYNDATLKLMEETNKKSVIWNSDPKDWSGKSSSQILNYIKGMDSSGSIILLHETEQTLEALPSIIEYLQETGLEIVSLD